MATEAQDRGLVLIKTYFTAYENKDKPVVAGLLAEDVVYETVFSRTGDPEPFYYFAGKEAAFGHIQEVMGNLKTIAFTDQLFTAGADGNAVFFEARGNMLTKKDAKYANRYLIKFDLAGGQIKKITEYANPVTFAKMNNLPLG